MRRLPLLLLNVAAIAPLVLNLAFGCASPPRTNPGGDHRYSNAPVGRLRFDGVYESRGVVVPGRMVMPHAMRTAPIQMPLSFSLTFDPDGSVSFLAIDESTGTGRVERGRYTVQGSDLAATIVIDPEGERPSEARYTGRVYADRLEVRLAWGPEFGDVPQQYRFVKREPVGPR